MTAGNLLKKVREKQLVSQLELSLELGITQQFVSNIECNRCPMPAQVIYLASQMFKVDPDKFINAQVRDYKAKLKRDVLSHRV